MVLTLTIILFPSSACTSASLEPSYVLRAIGADEDLAHSSIRYGLHKESKQICLHMPLLAMTVATPRTTPREKSIYIFPSNFFPFSEIVSVSRSVRYVYPPKNFLRLIR